MRCRSIVPNAAPLPHPRPLHWKKDASVGPLLARQMGHRPQHHRLFVPRLRVCDLQPTQRHACDEREHELHFCGNRGGHVYQFDFLDHDREEEVYRTR